MFHILVVDDDKNTRRLLKAVLEAEGYTVSTAEDGEDALDIMDSEVVDLVVLDIMMPKMDGYEFTKTLRDVNNNLPILMVSAKQLPEDKQQGFLVGTDDYMTKPIDETEMLLRIKALLRRAKIATEHKITIGDVVIDYDSLSVTKDGNTQELPQKEFMLLYNCFHTPVRFLPEYSLWTKFGVLRVIPAGKRLRFISVGFANALKDGRNLKYSLSEGWDIRR